MHMSVRACVYSVCVYMYACACMCMCVCYVNDVMYMCMYCDYVYVLRCDHNQTFSVHTHTHTTHTHTHTHIHQNNVSGGRVSFRCETLEICSRVSVSCEINVLNWKPIRHQDEEAYAFLKLTIIR